ncbi:hypothetical protein EB118_02165 [bacterium]|nr:hypothetical protein [bacterium]NDD83251.1 hypothetical protein [bacterium]NDG28893.1 hypothetical protein [bacterium]
MYRLVYFLGIGFAFDFASSSATGSATGSACTIFANPVTVTTVTYTYWALPSPTPDNIWLYEHNRERRLTSLTDLQADPQLSDLAISLSTSLALRGCPLEHNITGASRQNLYAAYGTTFPNVSDAISMWIDEKNLLSKPGVTFEETGHYLNIVAEDISKVGCGSGIGQDCVVITCNYS